MRKFIQSVLHPEGVITASEKQIELPERAAQSTAALDAFFSGLASSETNSIAKIRTLAKEFLANTEAGQNEVQ